MRARVAAASAAATAGSEPRPSSASPGNVARSMSSARAPRAASRASAYSTSTRDLEVAAGLPESPTTARLLLTLLTRARSPGAAGPASPWRRRVEPASFPTVTMPHLTPTPCAAAAGLRLSPSALVLVAANLVPLAGVLLFGWSVFATLLLFWVENVIVGGFNVLRMLWAQPDNPLIWVAKAGTIPFFIIHYGLFTTVHGVFVLTLFGGVHERGFPGPSTFLHAVQGAGIWPAALALAASHGVSFAFNYIGAGEYRTAALATLMSRPYGRVMVLHVVILGGGFLVQALGAPVAAIAMLVVLKTGLDLAGHLREHPVPIGVVRSA